MSAICHPPTFVRLSHVPDKHNTKTEWGTAEPFFSSNLFVTMVLSKYYKCIHGQNNKCMLETHQFHLSLHALTIKSFVAISANDTWQKMSIKVFIERENTGFRVVFLQTCCERFSVKENVRTGSMMTVCVCAGVYCDHQSLGLNIFGCRVSTVFIYLFFSSALHTLVLPRVHPVLHSELSSPIFRLSLLSLFFIFL